jgi:hypothetical protein
VVIVIRFCTGANLLLGLQAPVNQTIDSEYKFAKEGGPEFFPSLTPPEFFDLGETP